MNRHDIITLPNPKLRQTSRRVGLVDKQIKQLVKNMVAAATDWEQHRTHEVAAALAAIQVAEPYRVAIIREELGETDQEAGFFALINPDVVKQEGELVVDTEGCLSIKDVYGQVPRYPKVKIKAKSLDGRDIRFTAEGHLARVLQHEIDHMKGRLFIDLAGKDELFKMDEDGHLVPLTDKETEALELL